MDWVEPVRLYFDMFTHANTLSISPSFFFHFMFLHMLTSALCFPFCIYTRTLFLSFLFLHYIAYHSTCFFISHLKTIINHSRDLLSFSFQIVTMLPSACHHFYFVYILAYLATHPSVICIYIKTTKRIKIYNHYT